MCGNFRRATMTCEGKASGANIERNGYEWRKRGTSNRCTVFYSMEGIFL